MINVFSQKPKEEIAQPMPTCPFANRGCGQPAGLPSFEGMEGVDPLIFASILMKIVDQIEEKVKNALELNKSGFCIQIEPMQIFSSANPYLEYENLFTNEEGLDALNQMRQLRSELRDKTF